MDGIPAKSMNGGGSIDEIHRWLDGHSSSMKRTHLLREIIPAELPPGSYMALMPDVVGLFDAELHPMKLLHFCETGKGVSAIVHDLQQGKGDYDAPFERFDPNELRAGFSLQPNGGPSPPATLSHMRYSQVNGTASNNKQRVPSFSSSSSSAANTAKRLRTLSPAVSQVSPPTNGSGHPLVEGNGFSPSSSRLPSPPLPLAAAATVVERMRVPSPTAMASSSSPAAPPLPPGPPPPTKKLSASSLFALQDDQYSVEEEEDEDEDKTFPAEDGKQRTSALLKREMQVAVKALIDIADWPKPCRRMIKAFKDVGYPCGNPFAVPLTTESAGRHRQFLQQTKAAVPDEYFDTIQKPLDLITIHNRVQEDSTYLWFHQFESDVRLVAANALQFYASSNTDGTMALLAKHLQRKVDEQLARTYEILNSVSS